MACDWCVSVVRQILATKSRPSQVLDPVRLQPFTPIAGYDAACAFDKQQVRELYPEDAL